MAIQPTHDKNTAEEAAIRDLFRRLLDDWGRGDGEAFGSRFTEDAGFIAFDGSQMEGREDIASSHQQLFDTFLKDTRLTGDISNVKFLRPDVALVYATGSTVMRGKTRPSPERYSIQTLVAVKRNDEWLFAAFHNTRVRPIGKSTATFLIWAFSDLLWKVFGARKAAAHG